MSQTTNLVIDKLNFQKAEKIKIKPLTWKTTQDKHGRDGWLDSLLGFKQYK
jgi:hypothetical protein